MTSKNSKDLSCRLEKTILNLEEKLELYEAAIELSEVGFNLCDARGNVIKINESQVRITGHDPAYTLGNNMANIERDNYNVSAAMQVVKTRRPIVIEQTLPSGKSYLVYAQPYFDKNGVFKYVICNLVDNTRHNRIRKQLEEAKNDNLQLEKTVLNLQNYIDTQTDLQKALVYRSAQMKRIISICDKIAPFDSVVLITGETGTGKEVIANYIFSKSLRSGKPFIKVNCAAIPDTLLESELFGYESGAFTGARSGGKKGFFELANHGTLLLDEIGELPLPLQSKLLRVIQDGEFYRIGASSPTKTDVRLIASTNCNLEEMTETGSFRKDLYYRLSVIKIAVPSLDSRKEDIPLLIRHFVNLFNKKYNIHKEFTFESIECLTHMNYDGNVRDLQNMVERIMLLSHGDTVRPEDIEFLTDFDTLRELPPDTSSSSETENYLKKMVCQYEKNLLQTYWNKYGSASRIAEVLHTNQPTISRKLRRYGIL